MLTEHIFAIAIAAAAIAIAIADYIAVAAIGFTAKSKAISFGLFGINCPNRFVTYIVLLWLVASESGVCRIDSMLSLIFNDLEPRRRAIRLLQ